MIESTESTSPFIEINDVNTRFSRHFNPENNNRILFSGIFGIGKTFFLKKFFEQKEDCNTIFISPVKYSVADNKDIFELIKADILLQLFEKDLIEFDEEFKFDNLTHFSQYVLNNPIEIFKGLFPLLTMIDGVTEENVAPFNALIKLSDYFKSKLQQSKTKLEAKTNETQNKQIEYIKTIAEIPGSPFEDHFMTQFINEILNHISTKKKNILVIDDLDRLDPEHIFRILNILSVHNDNVGHKNKFGFSSIVLVCDIENIRKIFHHRYGTKVDFLGYIDKFYSTEMFHFSNNDAVKIFVEEKLDIELSTEGKEFFKFILAHLVQQGLMSLRQLLKFQFSEDIKIDNQIFHRIPYKYYNRFHEVKEPNFINFQNESLSIYTNEVELLHIIKILINIFGDYNELYKNIISLTKKENRPLGYNLRSVAKSLILIDRLMENCKNPSDFYFNEKLNEYSNEYELEWPTGKIFNNEYSFRLNYFNHTPYFDKDSLSYFDKMKINYNNHISPILLQDILTKFQEILEFLTKENLQQLPEFPINNFFNE